MQNKSKTILVTGSARRIGRVLSLAAAKSGWNVIIHHRDSLSDAEETKREIETIGQEATIFQADFSNPKSTVDFIKNVFSSGFVSAIINNASVFSNNNWSNTDLAQWNTHLAINLTAPFLLSQALGKSLPDNQDGRIINILDWRALRPGKDHFPYTISKAGLAALTKSMAISLAPNITVNGIALGAVLPPSDGGNTDDILSAVQIPRWAELSEVEDTMLFLLSGPKYITGEIIHLDGGRHLS
ncbi:MAG: SDR family NAD(P)-dependent oxidoreductase [Anaerolineales bacterium]